METPELSQGAKDSAVQAKADLGLVGRVRIKLAAPFFLLGMVLLPSSLRESFNDLEVSTDDEEE